MNFKKVTTDFDGIFLVEHRDFYDSRGFFSEIFSEEIFSEFFGETKFVQDNFSCSKKWTFRGFHFQTRKPQAKFIRVLSGKILDISIDIRPDSATFWKFFAKILSIEEATSILISCGFAHGFVALEDETRVFYKCDNAYDPGFEWGIFWNDREIGIDWDNFLQKFGLNKNSLIISEKDAKNPTFAEYKKMLNL